MVAASLLLVMIILMSSIKLQSSKIFFELFFTVHTSERLEGKETLAIKATEAFALPNKRMATLQLLLSFSFLRDEVRTRGG